MKIALSLLVAILLASCQTTPAPGPQVVCPARRHYTPAEEQAIGQAISKLDPTSPLIGMAGDYTAVLKEIDACNAAPHP